MAHDFTKNRQPNFHHGEETDVPLKVHTVTDGSRLQSAEVLPGENLAALTKRLYGSNNSLNREILIANNQLLEGRIVAPHASRN